MASQPSENSMKRPPSWPVFSAKEEHNVEWIVPSDSADYLDPRPRAGLYRDPLVMSDGSTIAMNSPIAFHRPRPEAQ
jgi:hypothetical protein